MRIEEKNIKDIKPYDNNPRKNDGAVEKVAESIKQCGYISPIIVDENMVVLAGHTRLKALKRLNKDKCKVMIVEGLTEEQKKKYRILDNKTNEFAEWDFNKLEAELAELDFDGIDFGFDFENENDEQSQDNTDSRSIGRYENVGKEEERSSEFFQDKESYTKDMQRTEDYEAFVDKFKAKHTTDDCYTPDNIHEVVINYVEKHYGLKRDDFVRPFYPGGDYKKYSYSEKTIVVDNPPFSIESEIVKWYCDNNIKFFIYAPTLTAFTCINKRKATAISVGAPIVYENGANVNTSFVTNLEDGIVARSCKELRKKLDEENNKNLEKIKKQLPSYKYPDAVATSAFLAKLSKYGIDFSIKNKESTFIRELDAQKEIGKAIFGGGFLLSEKAAAEKAAAEKAAAEVFELSEREKEIQKMLVD